MGLKENTDRKSFSQNREGEAIWTMLVDVSGLKLTSEAAEAIILKQMMDSKEDPTDRLEIKLGASYKK